MSSAEVLDNAFQNLCNAAAPRALYSAGVQSIRPRCHPRTRIRILQGLQAWLNAPIEAEPPIFFIEGDEGTGKSAISQTFCETTASSGQLLVSFFFKPTDPTRNLVRPVIATIASQLGVAHPDTRSIISQTVHREPFIFDHRLHNQL